MRVALLGFASLVVLTLSCAPNAEELPNNATKSPSSATESPYIEGRDYEVIAAAETASEADKNVVMEFFWYGCPHCSKFEPYLEKWQKTKPDNIVFQQVPAPLNPNWEPHSKAYYAAQMMDVLDKFHEPLFAAIHGKREKIVSESQLQDFAAKQGIDKDAFAKAMQSFLVDSNVRRAKLLAKKYNLRSVPVVIVSGKYRVDSTLAGGYDNLLKIVEYLIAKETAAENP